MKEKGTDESLSSPKVMEPWAHNLCEVMKTFRSVLTLFCSGAAQVCHVLRVVELKEQLEVEEEDGDRQEEKRKK